MTAQENILIAGGGPVGLTAAWLLAQNGIAVTLFEKEDSVKPDYRASTFHPATMDLFEGTGITEALLEMGIECPIVQYRTWDQGIIAEFDHAVLKDDTGYPFRLQCEQYKLAQWLQKELGSIDHVELLFGHEVTGFSQTDELVTITATDGCDEISRTGRFLIGADGGHSLVRKSLDIGFEGFTFPTRILVIGTTLDLRTVLPGLANVNYVSDPDYHGHILRIPDLWRMSQPLPNDVPDEEALSDEGLQARLRKVIPDLTLPDIKVRGIYTVHQRCAGSYRSGRVFLAGDAAHLNNPKGGMGLNGGLHDAFDLTSRITSVIKDKADESLLDGYEPLRRPEAINDIHSQTEQNVKNLTVSGEEARIALFDEWRRKAADPAEARQMLLNTSMISSLRRCGMLPG